MKLLFVVLILGFVSAQSRADDLNCIDRTLVRYHPGAKWDKFSDYIQEHMMFIIENMKNGTILMAGPTVEAGGGYGLYSSTDLAFVDLTVKKDPVIREGVATFSMQHWKACQLPAPAP